MTAFNERVCDDCIFHDERCTRWDCKCITRESADKIIEGVENAISEISAEKDKMIFEHNLTMDVFAGEYKGLRDALDIIIKHTKGGNQK